MVSESKNFLDVNEQDELRDIREQGVAIVEALRTQAVQNGTVDMSMAEFNREIELMRQGK